MFLILLAVLALLLALIIALAVSQRAARQRRRRRIYEQRKAEYMRDQRPRSGSRYGNAPPRRDARTNRNRNARRDSRRPR